jgi:hypothetical protein
MSDHDGVLMMQRLVLAGTLGLAVARKAAAILDGGPAGPGPQPPIRPPVQLLAGPDGVQAAAARSEDGAALQVILEAANECLGHFDDRPPADRWCDALMCLLDLAAFGDGLDTVA